MTYFLTFWLAAGIGFVIGAWWHARGGTDDKNADVKAVALRFAMEALEALGKRHRGGSVSARAAHKFISTQLEAQGIEL